MRTRGGSVGRWLRTDEAEEAVAAVESIAPFVRNISGDLYGWRWTILSVHTTVQGFMVLALRDSAGLNVLPKKLAAAWLTAHYQNGPYPAERLDSFLNLYHKVKNKVMAVQLDAQAFKPSGSQGKSIRSLNALRNSFVHFLPASWSIEVSGLPRICLDSLNLVEYLASGYRPLLWHDRGHPARVVEALAEARKVLLPLRESYEGGAT